MRRMLRHAHAEPWAWHPSQNTAANSRTVSACPPVGLCPSLSDARRDKSVLELCVPSRLLSHVPSRLRRGRCLRAGRGWRQRSRARSQRFFRLGMRCRRFISDRLSQSLFQQTDQVQIQTGRPSRGETRPSTPDAGRTGCRGIAPAFISRGGCGLMRPPFQQLPLK